MAEPHYSKTPYIVTIDGEGSGGGSGSSMRFISGEGAPTEEVGQPGDVYLNESNGDLYNNVNGTWTLSMNLVGPQGPQGPQGEEGPQGPQGPAGADGVDGADGVSVTGATSDGVNITFELSDGGTIVVPWPAQA